MRATFARIVASVPALKPFIDDPAVTDMMVIRGGQAAFIDRGDGIEPTDITLPREALEHAIVRIAHANGDDVSEEQPVLDARLEDGSRVAAILPPAAVDGPTMTIRKFGERYTLAQLIKRDTLTDGVA